MFEIGRICLKIAGREAGRYCCIVNTIDAQHVLVTGPREVTAIRRRQCNIRHLEPTGEKIKITADASDGDVFTAYEHASLFEKLKLEKPTPEQIEQMRQRKAEKLAKKKEEGQKGQEKKEAAKKEKEKASKQPKKPKEEKKAETAKELKPKDEKKAEKPKEAKKAAPREPKKAEEKN